MKAKVSVGVPYYGSFSGEWVSHIMQLMAKMDGVEVVDIITAGVMTADHNRNMIADKFKKSTAEWLFWIDSDTIVPVGAVPRMLSHGRTLVSGLYYGKNEPHPPIAYFVHNGAFTPIDKKIRWERGNILEVDAVGMGCMLTHRSVFEDIEKNFEVLQLPTGGIVTVNKKNVIGELSEFAEKHEHDGKVYRGQYRVRLRRPTLADLKFPFFMIENNKTEDVYFFDLARQVGHTPVLDTTVECSHLRWNGFSGNDWRNINGR